MADPGTKALVELAAPLLRSMVDQTDEVITNTRLGPKNMSVDPEEALGFKPDPKAVYFDNSTQASQYVTNHIRSQPTPTTRGLPHIYVKSNDDIFTRRTAKAIKTSLKEVSEPSHMKLSVYDALQKSSELRRSREAIPEDDIFEIFKRFGREERADDYIKYVKEGNKAVMDERDLVNQEAGYLKVSYGHKKALSKGGKNLPRNVEVEDYIVNVSRGANDEIEDELLRAMDVPFSWEEDIIKWIDPTVGSFWGSMSLSQRQKVMKAISLWQENPDINPAWETVTDIVDDFVGEFFGMPSNDAMVRKIVGKTPRSKQK